MKKIIITLAAALSLISAGAQTKQPKYVPVYLADGKFIYVDTKTGEKCARSEEYELCSWFHDGVALVFDEGFASCHYIDEKFHRVLPNNFIDATIFSEGVAFICDDGMNFKAIDKDGAVKFTLRKAINVYPFQGGMAVFKGINDKMGVVSSRGTVVIPPIYSEISPTYNNCMKVTTEEGRQGLISPDGAIILDLVYEDLIWNKATAFSSLVPVFENNRYALYDSAKGQFISPFVYDFIHPDRDMIAYVTDKSSGWMNLSGDKLINSEAGIDLFGPAELAPVQTAEGLWGYVNFDGQMVIGATYQSAESFDDCGTAVVGKQGRYGLITSKGSLLVPPTYSSIEYVGNGIYKFRQKNMVGALNSSGKIVVKPSEQYMDIPDVEEDLECAGLRN
ncbi:MAG: WG repeat-containing protein [Bacteroidales bacterium]|nr:WG repeat-containing protein [Bacteroidales bacterium]